jgi:hypothetical protein
VPTQQSAPQRPGKIPEILSCRTGVICHSWTETMLSPEKKRIQGDCAPILIAFWRLWRAGMTSNSLAGHFVAGQHNPAWAIVACFSWTLPGEVLASGVAIRLRAF